jgi:hypothetical protein
VKKEDVMSALWETTLGVTTVLSIARGLAALLFLALMIALYTDGRYRRPRPNVAIIRVDAGEGIKSFNDLTEEDIVAAMDRLGLET